MEPVFCRHRERHMLFFPPLQEEEEESGEEDGEGGVGQAEGDGYPYAATTLQGTRADGCGEFTIAFEKKPVWDIYIYFAREDGTAYSPSRYLFVFYSIKKIWDNMLYSLFYE